MANSRIIVWIYVLLGALSGLLVVAISSAHPWAAVDDAFITYRYADNLRHGLGFVYNPGEAVLGTTTPLYGFLLGVIGLLLPGVEMASIGFWLAGFAWIASVWMAAFFFWGFKQPATALFAALLVAAQPVMFTHLGMETSLVIFLMLASAWAWQQQRWAWAVLFSALLILTRQDGALWILLLGAEEWRRRRRLPWRETVAVVALCLPWFVFAWWQYGSILPNSVLAKAGQVQRMAAEGIPSIWERFWLYLSAGHHLPYSVVLIGIVLSGVIVVFFRQRHLWWLPVWVLCYLLIYQLLGVISFIWYFLPPLVVVSLLAGMGLGGLLKAAQQMAGWIRWPVLATVFLALAFLLFIRGGRVLAEQQRLSLAQSQLHPYHAASLWLASHAEADATVATIEIGAIGYHIPNPILDTMGLVSPEMRPALTGWSDSLFYAVSTYWPEYIISLPGTAWGGMLPQWWFQEMYVQAAQFDNISVYQRVRMPADKLLLSPNAVYTSGLTLREVSFSDHSLTAGTDIEAWLFFSLQAEQPSNYQFTFYWIDTQTGERFALETVWPFYLEGAYPSNRWPVDQTIQLPVRVNVPVGMPVGSYRLGLYIYDSSMEKGLSLATAPDADYPEVQVGYFRLGDPPDAALSADIAAQSVQTRWQEGIELASVGLSDHPLAAGDVLPVHFDWRAYAEITRDLTVFLHILNADGGIVAQNDRRPFDGRFPTAVWRAGEALNDTVLVSLPPELATGNYSIRVGLYDEAGRLPLASGDGDSLLVEGVITIEDAP